MSLKIKVVNLLCLWFFCELKLSDSGDSRSGRYLVFQNFNHDYNFRDDRNSDYHFRNSRFKYNNEISSQPWEESSPNSDKLDFHYPKVQFLTKMDRKYSISNVESENDDTLNNDNLVVDTMSKPTRFSRRNPHKIQKVYTNEIPLQPVKLVYIEKVPKPTENITYENKYEENEVIKNSNTTTTNKIHDILRSYLLKLFSQKYNNTESTSLSPNTESELPENGENTKDEAENKFIGGVTTKLKQKVRNKAKLFSLFTIIQFNNTQCNATRSSVTYSGVCYTQEECNRIQGTAVGNCARGYGVCCLGTYFYFLLCSSACITGKPRTVPA